MLLTRHQDDGIRPLTLSWHKGAKPRVSRVNRSAQIRYGDVVLRYRGGGGMSRSECRFPRSRDRLGADWNLWGPKSRNGSFSIPRSGGLSFRNRPEREGAKRWSKKVRCHVWRFAAIFSPHFCNGPASKSLWPIREQVASAGQFWSLGHSWCGRECNQHPLPRAGGLRSGPNLSMEVTSGLCHTLV